MSKDKAIQANADRLICLREVLAYIPVSKSTWWKGCEREDIRSP